jgi:hypothetical protein
MTIKHMHMYIHPNTFYFKNLYFGRIVFIKSLINQFYLPVPLPRGFTMPQLVSLVPKIKMIKYHYLK